MRYYFEWDPDKAKTNKDKHRLSFERATQIFLDPLQISIFDKKHSLDEERWITIGKDGNDVLLVVVHTFEEREDECNIRIISARKATKRESKQYKEFQS